MTSRVALTAFVFARVVCAADSPISQATAKLEAQAAKAPTTVTIELRLYGAQALQARYPELARKLADGALADLHERKSWMPGGGAMQALFELAPAEVSPQMAIVFLVRANRMDEAVALYKKTVAGFPDPLRPADALWLINASGAVTKALPEEVAENYERVLRAASALDFGGDGKSIRVMQSGSTTITVDNTRDTVLIQAGSRLRAMAPERFAKYKDLFAKWDIQGPAMIRSAGAPMPPEVAAISKRIGTMRGLPTDADRAQLAKALVPEIRALPEIPRLSLIRGLAGVATEGDLGKDTLGAIAGTLADALRQASKQQGSFGDLYLELAKLVRYEHVTVPADPSLDAAQALLALREQVQQENGFSLTSLDGKTYSLDALKGKIVLLNFWATWCPPCRKEMPDMEKLYRKFEAKGLTVIAVSDEERETVVNFLAKNNYSFPIALDPGRKVNTAFAVEGIPKSFIFDREGRLAAQAIDMRTESQFMELLKMAGLE